MNDYATALKRHLEGRLQDQFAADLGTTQTSVSRYATGTRFPNAEIAREIDRVTAGEVPFALWQAVALRKFGIAA
jgi:DNA-binding transcriptional regulator YdaS (Cro superfamily)